MPGLADRKFFTSHGDFTQIRSRAANMGTSTRIRPQHQCVRKTLVDITIKNGNFQDAKAMKVPALVVVNSYHNPLFSVCYAENLQSSKRNSWLNTETKPFLRRTHALNALFEGRKAVTFPAPDHNLGPCIKHRR